MSSSHFEGIHTVLSLFLNLHSVYAHCNLIILIISNNNNNMTLSANSIDFAVLNITFNQSHDQLKKNSRI